MPPALSCYALSCRNIATLAHTTQDVVRSPLTTFSRILPKSARREMLMYIKKVLLLALIVPAFSLALAAAGDDGDTFIATLRGLDEVPPVATAGTGSFTGTLSPDGSTLTYKLTYDNLNAQVLFSHIHFGLPREATGIMVFLCGPAAGAMGGPPAGTPNPPPCPVPTSGMVNGTVTAANEVGHDGQG